MTPRRLVSLTAALVTLCLAGPGFGQPSRAEVRAAFGPAGKLVRLVTVWDRGARLVVGKADPISLHRGEVAATLTAGHGRVLVAFAVDHAREPFRLRLLGDDGLGEPIRIARPGERHDLPFAVAATPTPNGFAVFFQEIERRDPSAAHSYLVRLDQAGQPAGAATEIPVPWALADAAWNGAGFHLALIYPGGGDGMRLSMVSTTKAGRPEQHPDWASRAGYVTDVHLVAEDGKVRAFYRGGAGGDRLLERDVTAIGSWGREPGKARDHGALAADRAIAISKTGKPIAVEGAGLE